MICMTDFKREVSLSLQALRRLVYTNEPSVFSALCPCLNSILRVIESTSDAKELRGKVNWCHVMRLSCTRKFHLASFVLFETHGADQRLTT